MCKGTGNCLGYAAKDADGVLEPWHFDRREGKMASSSLVNLYGVQSG